MSPLLERLTSLGMSQYEAKVYVSLLRQESLTVSDISQISGIPRTKAYEIVSSLEKKGFLVLYPTKPVKYKVVHPKNIFKIFEEESIKKHEKRIQAIKEARDEILPELESAITESPFFSNSMNVASVIRGRSNIAKYLTDFLMESLNHVYIMASYRRYALLSETVDDVFFKKIKANGVDIRLATPVDKKNLPLVKDISKHVNIRYTSEPHTGFFTFDGQKALLITRTDPKQAEYDAGLIVDNPEMVSMLNNLFESRWEVMEDLNDRIKNIK